MLELGLERVHAARASPDGMSGNMKRNLDLDLDLNTKAWFAGRTRRHLGAQRQENPETSLWFHAFDGPGCELVSIHQAFTIDLPRP